MDCSETSELRNSRSKETNGEQIALSKHYASGGVYHKKAATENSGLLFARIEVDVTLSQIQVYFFCNFGLVFGFQHFTFVHLLPCSAQGRENRSVESLPKFDEVFAKWTAVLSGSPRLQR